MAFKYGPSIVTDGLKLYLDKYNEQSYPGEPTTNVVHYTNLNTGWSKGYNTNIVFDELPPPIGIEKSSAHQTTVSFDDLLGGGGYWYSYGDHAPQDPSTTYTVSVYVQTVQSTPVSIAMYTADNSEAGRFFSNSHYFTRDGETDHLGAVINNNIPDANGWVRIVWPAFTSTSNAQSDSLSFSFGGFNDPATTPNRTSLCAPQMEAKSHATKYVGNSANNGTVTTRPTADGWKDLSGNGFHGDLNNITYSATNIPGTDRNDFSFAGTDDYVHVTPAPDWADYPYVTGSAWIKTTSTANPNYAFISWNNSVNAGGINCSTLTDGKFLVSYRDHAWPGTGSYPTLTSTTTVNDGEWHHCVFTYDATGAKIYVDGVQEASATRNSTMYNISSEIFYLGTLANHPPGNYPFDGSVDCVKIYNRALTSSEVLQNFNAHKKRYGL